VALLPSCRTASIRSGRAGGLAGELGTSRSGLLDRALAPPIALDDRGLECLPEELGYLQPNLTGMRLALVMAGSGITTSLAALVALGITQPICLSVQQGIQRFLHAASHDPVEVALDPIVVNCEDIAQRTRTVKLMVFELIIAASKTWRRLNGTNQLPKVIGGVRFQDGIEVIEVPANCAD